MVFNVAWSEKHDVKCIAIDLMHFRQQVDLSIELARQREWATGCWRLVGGERFIMVRVCMYR